MFYTEEIKQKIIDLYNSNNNTVQISELLQISQTGVERYLKRENLYKKVNRSLFSEIEKQNICNLYVFEKLNTKEISNIFACSDTCILKILKAKGINTSIISRYNNCKNLNYFSKIDSEEKAYLLGFIYTDGSINKKLNTLSIELNKKDAEILKKIANIFGLPHSSIKETRKNCIKLNIHSRQLCLDLFNLNVKPNKTYRKEIPIVPDDLLNHFFRGCIDGDGSITKTTICLYSKNENMINFFKKFLLENNVDENAIFLYSNTSCLRISVFKKEFRSIIFNILYSSATIFLERKKISPF